MIATHKRLSAGLIALCLIAGIFFGAKIWPDVFAADGVIKLDPQGSDVIVSDMSVTAGPDKSFSMKIPDGAKRHLGVLLWEFNINVDETPIIEVDLTGMTSGACLVPKVMDPTGTINYTASLWPERVNSPQKLEVNLLEATDLHGAQRIRVGLWVEDYPYINSSWDDAAISVYEFSGVYLRPASTTPEEPGDNPPALIDSPTTLDPNWAVKGNHLDVTRNADLSFSMQLKQTVGELHYDSLRWNDLNIDLNEVSVLAIENIGLETQYTVKIYKGEQLVYSIDDIIDDDGQTREIDLELTGLSGEQRLTIVLYIVDYPYLRSNYNVSNLSVNTFRGIRLVKKEMYNPGIDEEVRVLNPLADIVHKGVEVYPQSDGSFMLKIPEGNNIHYAALVWLLEVDVDKTPLLEYDIQDMLSGAAVFPQVGNADGSVIYVQGVNNEGARITDIGKTTIDLTKYGLSGVQRLRIYITIEDYPWLRSEDPNRKHTEFYFRSVTLRSYESLNADAVKTPMAINLTGLRSSSMNINSMGLYGAIFTTMQDAPSTVNSIAFSIRPDTDEVRFLYFDFRDTEGITTITLTYSTGESFTLAPFPVGTKTRYRIDLRSPDGKAKFSGIQDISVNISFNDGLAGVAANYLFNGIFLDNDPFSFELEDNRTTVDNDTVLPASGWAYLKKQVRFSSPSKYAFVFGPSAEATEDQARMFYAVRADMDKIKYLLFNVKSVPDVYNIYLLDYSSSEPILLYDVNDEDSLFGYAGEEGLFAVELSRYVDWKGVKDFIIVITCDDLTRQQDFEFEYIALTTSAKAPAIDDEELLPEEVDTGDPFAMAAVPAILAIGGLVALVLTKARKRRLNSR